MSSIIKPNELRNYISTYCQVYRETAEKLLPESAREKLSKFKFLDCHIVGYISRFNGVAIDYFCHIQGKKDIEIKESNWPIEEMIFGLKKRTPSKEGVVFNVKFTGPGNLAFEKLCMDGYIRCPLAITGKFTNVLIENCTLAASKLDYARFVSFLEIYGDNSKKRWSTEVAISEAIRCIHAAHLDYQQSIKSGVDLFDLIDPEQTKRVLILGDYSGEESKRLDLISNVLQEKKWHPFMIKDAPDIKHFALKKKVKLYASISRFVVMDLSSNSGQLVEKPYLEQDDSILAVMRLKGSHVSFMGTEGEETNKNIKFFDYDLDNLEASINSILEWVEKRIDELGQHYSKCHPWRKG